MTDTEAIAALAAWRDRTRRLFGDPTTTCHWEDAGGHRVQLRVPPGVRVADVWAPTLGEAVAAAIAEAEREP